MSGQAVLSSVMAAKALSGSTSSTSENAPPLKGAATPTSLAAPGVASPPLQPIPEDKPVEVLVAAHNVLPVPARPASPQAEPLASGESLAGRLSRRRQERSGRRITQLLESSTSPPLTPTKASSPSAPIDGVPEEEAPK